MTRHYTIKETQAHLPAILDEVAAGETVVIEDAGKAVATIIAAASRPADPGSFVSSRFGGLEGRYQVPDDFDNFGKDEIDAMFGLKE